MAVLVNWGFFCLCPFITTILLLKLFIRDPDFGELPSKALKLVSGARDPYGLSMSLKRAYGPHLIWVRIPKGPSTNTMRTLGFSVMDVAMYDHGLFWESDVAYRRGLNNYQHDGLILVTWP